MLDKIEKLLIGNRGEIACRVAKTARRLGIPTVAVYSDADAGARHVELADEAWPIGPAPARESYLSIDKILDVARRSGARAVHPGYGFLAENAEFAERCAHEGLIFVGPPARAMRLIGSKASAKDIMERAGVPTVPGYHGDAAQVQTFVTAAERIGFPVLIKASAGGGGRGMRIVERTEDLAGAMAAAEREAVASFGDGSLLLEKYLDRPRHIEVQIFADAHGDIVSFLERDCSLQRRHQKILEETPAFGLSNSLRQAIREAAIVAVRAVDYVGAGTVEFLAQGEDFYFLEMNARLQVEHPITEMVARQDLVEWQLRVACGERLPRNQGDLVMRGAAIEVRICAEEPAQGFLPSIGLIEHLRLPVETRSVRIDTGVRRGDRITQYYDSLLAKLVVWGDDRAAAIAQLRSVLDAFELVGVQTNLDFLRALIDHPLYISGDVDTGFVEREAVELIAKTPLSVADETIVVAAGAVIWLADLRSDEQARALRAGNPWSPWSLADGWRTNSHAYAVLEFLMGQQVLAVRIWPLPDGGMRLQMQQNIFFVRAREEGDRVRLSIDGVVRSAGIVRRRDGIVVILNGRNYSLVRVDPLVPLRQKKASGERVSAPMPARVTSICVRVDDEVKSGAPLVVLEAMKMEITLRAPRDVRIGKICCSVGEMTPEGAELIVFAEDKTA